MWPLVAWTSLTWTTWCTSTCPPARRSSSTALAAPRGPARRATASHSWRRRSRCGPRRPRAPAPAQPAHARARQAAYRQICNVVGQPQGMPRFAVAQWCARLAALPLTTLLALTRARAGQDAAAAPDPRAPRAQTAGGPGRGPPPPRRRRHRAAAPHATRRSMRTRAAPTTGCSSCRSRRTWTWRTRRCVAARMRARSQPHPPHVRAGVDAVRLSLAAG